MSKRKVEFRSHGKWLFPVLAPRKKKGGQALKRLLTRKKGGSTKKGGQEHLPKDRPLRVLSSDKAADLEKLSILDVPPQILSEQYARARSFYDALGLGLVISHALTQKTSDDIILRGLARDSAEQNFITLRVLQDHLTTLLVDSQPAGLQLEHVSRPATESELAYLTTPLNLSLFTSTARAEQWLWKYRPIAQLAEGAADNNEATIRQSYASLVKNLFVRVSLEKDQYEQRVLGGEISASTLQKMLEDLNAVAYPVAVLESIIVALFSYLSLRKAPRIAFVTRADYGNFMANPLFLNQYMLKPLRDYLEQWSVLE